MEGFEQSILSVLKTDAIIAFLKTQQLSAWETIVTAIVSSMLFWIGQGFFKIILNSIKRLVRWLLSLLVKGYKRTHKSTKEFFFGSLGLNEFIELEEKIEQGEQLNWWKKRKYKRSKFNKMQIEFAKKIRDGSIKVNLDTHRPYVPSPMEHINDLLEQNKKT